MSSARVGGSFEMNRQSQQLPAGFDDLCSFVDTWAWARESDRAKQRWTTDYEESKQFYNAMLPRLEAALSYLDGFDINHLPEPERRLLFLTLALAEVANAVEIYHTPEVPNALSPERYRPTHFDNRI